MATEINTDKMYSLDELVLILNVTKRTLSNKLRRGELYGRKVGKSWLISGKALFDYVHSDNSELEAQILADELAHFDKRFSATSPAFVNMVIHAPNRKSMLYQIANFIKSVRESDLNK